MIAEYGLDLIEFEESPTASRIRVAKMDLQ